MDGILNVLKPPGMTSFDVVGYIRKLTRIKKIGHTGTLDPGAVGVLPICIGNATKAIEYITNKNKLYRAELTLGISTDTQDSFGKVMDIREASLSEKDINAVIEGFTGKQQQIPPMYSAVKINGKRLYELARKGETVERQPRDIEIFYTKVIKVQMQSEQEKESYISKLKGISDFSYASIKPNMKVMFDVACSKGTYIRTLCADIGNKLGCGGNMSFLLRLKTGEFDISSAVTLDQICEWADINRLEEHLISVEKVFCDLDRLQLNETQERKFLNGVPIQVKSRDCKENETIRIYDSKNDFIALGELVLNDGTELLKSKKIFKNME